MDSFWLVWLDGVPPRRCETHSAAIYDAEKLAVAYQKDVYILEAYEVVRVQKIVRDRLTNVSPPPCA